MNLTLADFQDTFVDCLWAADDSLSPHQKALALQPGFAVYRNTMMKASIDALQANFPTVCTLVGETWFRAAAALHVRERPPDDARLWRYGQHFPAFLRAFPHASDLPYLEGVARLDRFWIEAHAASDAATCDPAMVKDLSLEEWGDLILTPHPAARWAWFDDQAIFTLWRHHRENLNLDAMVDPTGRGEGALITRPTGKVQWMALDAAGCEFLNACRAGLPLPQAVEAAMAQNPAVDLAALMASLLNAGAFRAETAFKL